MPIYEYRCAACGHELESLQKLRDAPLSVCPACNKAELKKLLSAAGFQLKGSGWYVTDFRNSGGKPAAKEKPAGTETAPAGNGSAAAASTSDASSSIDAAKGDGKAADRATPASSTESKPAAAAPAAASTKPTTSTTKSDT